MYPLVDGCVPGGREGSVCVYVCVCVTTGRLRSLYNKLNIPTVAEKDTATAALATRYTASAQRL